MSGKFLELVPKVFGFGEGTYSGFAPFLVL